MARFCGILFFCVLALGGALVSVHAANVLEISSERYPARLFWWVVSFLAVGFALEAAKYAVTTFSLHFLTDASETSFARVGTRIVALVLSLASFSAPIVVIVFFLRDFL